jgi:hypothetical protein
MKRVSSIKNFKYNKDIPLEMLNKVSLRNYIMWLNCLDEWKKILLRLIEIIAFLSIGLLFTTCFLRPTYENFGILFTGNVWVNWFGVSYIFFVLHTLVVGLCISKESILFKKRLTSVFFWLIFIGSNYVVFIPFIKGENPF